MQLYNTLSRTKEALPAPPGPIRMYVCGPTVYQRIHVGNARPYVISMWLRRWLERTGYDVTLVENITDVNDKIYDARPGKSAELAREATAWYIEDTDDLGLGRPDHEPRATETIPEQIALIEELVDRGLAYPVDGDVYFRVTRYAEYGALSNQRPDELEEQEPNPSKEDPRDFALWKGTKPGEDTSWESPWGRGRPGWHIECSAMAEKHFGSAFEIHGGGLDLVFPHHENELAQSRGAGRDFAKIWMHNGMLRFVGEKMSKSLGNVVTLRDALDEWGRETLLVFFLTGHWGKPLDYSDETLAAARLQAARFQNAFLGWEGEPAPMPPEAFAAAVDDDFNTPSALALMHRWLDERRLDLVYPCLELFGLEALATTPEAPEEVVDVARRRQEARDSGDFATSDRLRDEIAALGWEVRDEAGGFRLVPR